MAEFDLTGKVAQFVDPHLLLPVLNWLEESKVLTQGKGGSLLESPGLSAVRRTRFHVFCSFSGPLPSLCPFLFFISYEISQYMHASLL